MNKLYLLSIGMLCWSGMSGAMDDGASLTVSSEQTVSDVTVSDAGGVDALPPPTYDVEANTTNNRLLGECWRCGLKCVCVIAGFGAVGGYFLCKIVDGDDCPLP